MSNAENTGTPFLDSLKASWAEAEAVRASGVLEQAPRIATPTPKTYARGEVDADGFARFVTVWGNGMTAGEKAAPVSGCGRSEKIPARGSRS